MMNSPNPFLKNKKRPAIVNFHQNVSNFISPKKQKRENMPGVISADGSQHKPNLVRPSLIQEERKKLPIFAVRRRWVKTFGINGLLVFLTTIIGFPFLRLVEEIQKNSTLIVIGETGCGKTTQIPQFIHESNIGKKGLIAITQVSWGT